MGFSGDILLNPKEIRAETSDQRHPMGCRGYTTDGRSYRYCQAGEALDVGVPVTPAALIEGSKDTVMTAPLTSTDDITSTWSKIPIDAALTTGTAAHDFKDGYLFVNYSTVTDLMGSYCLIEDSDASSTSTTSTPGHTTLSIELADDEWFPASLSTDDIVIPVMNPYRYVLEHDGGTMVGQILGVPNKDITDQYYFWAQTWGPCPVLQDSTWGYGYKLISSTGSDQGLSLRAYSSVANDTFFDGSTALQDDYISVLPQVEHTYRMDIGWCMTDAGTDDRYGLVYLTISP